MTVTHCPEADANHHDHLSINNVPSKCPRAPRSWRRRRRPASASPRCATSKGLQAIGACRVCVVEVEGARNLVASCSMPVGPGHEGVHQHPPGPRGPADGGRTAALRAQRRVPDLRPQRGLRAAGPGRRAGHPRGRLRRREDPQADRHLHARPGARQRQVHQVPPLRERLPGDAARRGPVPAEPRLRDGDRPGLQPRPDDRGLRAVRPVRGRLPRRRDHREGPDRGGLEGARQARQPRHRADRAGDPRGPGRVFRLSARHAGDRQDGRRPAAAGLPRRLRHQLRRRPDDHRRGHRAARRGCRRPLVDKQPVALPMFTSCSPGWIKFMEYFHPDLLPNLSTCKSPQQMFGAVAKTYYAAKLGKRPEQIVRGLGHALHGEEVRVPAAGDGRQRRPRRGRRADHARAGQDDPRGGHRLRTACPTKRWTPRWASPPAPPTSSPTPAA